MRLDTIDTSEALRYMGVKGEPDDTVAELLNKYSALLAESLNARYVYKRVGLTFSEDGVRADGPVPALTGSDIRRHLDGCSEAVFLAATLTADADKLIRRAAAVSAAEALVCDSLCSAAIEQVCNKAENEIFCGSEPVYRTWRFSPGYGDLPLSLQPELLGFLNAGRRIGLTVNPSGMLVPTKSVTAVIGISETPREPTPHGCAACNMRGRCIGSRCKSAHQ